jgi:hypothetical protein
MGCAVVVACHPVFPRVYTTVIEDFGRRLDRVNAKTCPISLSRSTCVIIGIVL